MQENLEQSLEQQEQDIQALAEFGAECYAGDPAPCAAACPFGVDVVRMVGFAQRDNWRRACSLLREHVLFPGIVSRLCPHPCTTACLRSGLDAAVELPRLEQTAVQLGTAPPRRTAVPRRSQRAAIVGAGLCGLSCAVKLAAGGFSVTVLEQREQLGGRLSGLLPEADYLPELQRQLGLYSIELRCGEQVEEIPAGYDAVLLATGAPEAAFGLQRRSACCETQRPGVFVAGGAAGPCGDVQPILQGMQAARAMESYMLTGTAAVSPPAPRPSTRITAQTMGLTPMQPGAWTDDCRASAVAEAKRCALCSCHACQDACDMLQSYRQLPRQAAQAAQGLLKLSGDIKLRTTRIVTDPTKRMLSSCSDCGACGAACTEGIDVGRLAMESRRLMHQKGTLPPVFHEFWLRDMHHARGEQVALVRNAPGTAESQQAFFPGCQLGASNPDYVLRTYAWLLRRNPATGLMLTCCGSPAYWAGDAALQAEIKRGLLQDWQALGRPTLLMACPTCAKRLRQWFPELPQRMLYAELAEALPASVPCGGQTVSVFDPCASREDPGAQQDVRTLLRRTGLTLEELPRCGRHAACCGYGGQIYTANPELAQTIAQRRTAMGQRPYVTYCANCRDIFAGQGKQCSHVLDVVFGLDDGLRSPPSLTRRRQNRAALRAQLLRQFWQEDVEMEQQAIRLLISDEVTQTLNKRLILEDDVAEVIGFCERTGSKLLQPDTGRWIGHRRLGQQTYWVIYGPEDDGFRVFGAYCHRFVIEGESECTKK